MNLTVKKMVFGFLVWLIPFLFAFLIWPLHETMLPLFKSIMVVFSTATVFLILYFKFKRLSCIESTFLPGVNCYYDTFQAEPARISIFFISAA